MKLHISIFIFYSAFAAPAIAKDVEHKSTHQLNNDGDYSSDADKLSISKKSQTPLRGVSAKITHNDDRKLSSFWCEQWGLWCPDEPDEPEVVVCEDTNGWMDEYGDGCDWYAIYDSCESWGHITGANEHCCVCGGSNQCKDSPIGWYDSDGPTYDCAWYAQGTNCEDYGNSYADVFGITANIACCACDGGCYDSPNGWVDSYGDGCEWYTEGNRCEDYGNDFADAYNVTANKACCECGGGNHNYWRNSVRSAPANKDMILTKYPEDKAKGKDFHAKSLGHAKVEGTDTKHSEKMKGKSIHGNKSLDDSKPRKTKKHPPQEAKEKSIQGKPNDHSKPKGKE